MACGSAMSPAEQDETVVPVQYPSGLKRHLHILAFGTYLNEVIKGQV